MTRGGLLENVYYISWSEHADISDDRPDEYVIPVDQGNQPPLRVKMVKTSGFEWLYQILADTSPPVPMNPKHLRHLAARVIDLIRTDIPRNNVEIDYTKVEHLSENANQLALVLGISNVTNSNLDHPFTITVAAEHLGLRGWNGIKTFIEKANSIVGYDIRASDNEYHTKIKTGKSESSFTRKYSAAFIRLIRRVMGEGAPSLFNGGIQQRSPEKK